MKQVISTFYESTVNFGNAINSHRDLYSDPRFKELKGMMGEIAKTSREVLAQCEKYETSQKSFQKTASEKNKADKLRDEKDSRK